MKLRSAKSPCMNLMRIAASMSIALCISASAHAEGFGIRETSIAATLVPLRVTSDSLALATTSSETTIPPLSSAVGCGLSGLVGWNRVGISLGWQRLEAETSQKERPDTIAVSVSATEYRLGVEVKPIDRGRGSLSIGAGVKRTLPKASYTSNGRTEPIRMTPSTGWYGEAKAAWLVDPDLFNLGVVVGVRSGKSEGTLPATWDGVYAGMDFGVVF